MMRHFGVKDYFSYYERFISFIRCYYNVMSIDILLLFRVLVLLLLLTLLLLTSLTLTLTLTLISLTSITNLMISNSFLINPHALPTLYAVSILSPVNIHTLIFALSKSLIVYGTSSCRSSCTAVAPNKNKFDYNYYCSFYNYLVLFYYKYLFDCF